MLQLYLDYLENKYNFYKKKQETLLEELYKENNEIPNMELGTNIYNNTSCLSMQGNNISSNSNYSEDLKSILSEVDLQVKMLKDKNMYKFWVWFWVSN